MDTNVWHSARRLALSQLPCLLVIVIALQLQVTNDTWHGQGGGGSCDVAQCPPSQQVKGRAPKLYPMPRHVQDTVKLYPMPRHVQDIVMGVTRASGLQGWQQAEGDQDRNGIPSTGSEASTSASPASHAPDTAYPIMKIDDDDGTLAELDRAVEAWVVSLLDALHADICAEGFCSRCGSSILDHF